MQESLSWFRLGRSKGIHPFGTLTVQEARVYPELSVMTPKQHESHASTWSTDKRYSITCNMRKSAHLSIVHCDCVFVDVCGFEL
jgi:hypothetical protein